MVDLDIAKRSFLNVVTLEIRIITKGIPTMSKMREIESLISKLESELSNRKDMPTLEIQIEETWHYQPKS